MRGLKASGKQIMRISRYFKTCIIKPLHNFMLISSRPSPKINALTGFRSSKFSRDFYLHNLVTIDTLSDVHSSVIGYSRHSSILVSFPYVLSFFYVENLSLVLSRLVKKNLPFFGCSVLEVFCVS